MLLAAALGLGACTSGPADTADLLDVRRWEDTRTLAGDSLATVLRDGDLELRAAAARAMGRIGHADALVPLTRALTDAHERVRREAAFALGILGHPDAIGSLVRRLDLEDDVEATAQVCLALGRIGGEETAELLHPIARSPYPRLREASIEALALLADSTSVPVLRRATLDSVPSVVWRAAYALEKVPDPASYARLIDLTAHEFSLVRRYAIRSLGRIGATEAADDVAALRPSGADGWHEKVRIADPLGRLGVDSETVRTCLRAMLDDPVVHVRVAALQAIQRAGWTAFAADVRAMADDPTVDVRAARLDALAALDAAAHADAFEAALDDSAAIVADTALAHVGATATDAAIARLRAVLATDAPRATRMAAARGLVAAGDAVDAAVRVDLLADRDVFVATIAAGGIGEDDPAGGALLAAADRDDDPSGELRRAVFAALARVGATEAIDRLRRALDAGRSPWVRIAARDALAELLPHEADRAALPTAEEILLDPRPVPRPPDQPALVAQSTALEIVLTTRHGEVVIRPLVEEAPQMAESFARLAAAGRFDGSMFHRVVPDFVVQGGDPTGTGWGDAGYTIRSEWNRETYDRGKVGIAHSGKDTGSCQLFVTHAPQPHLDARYTIWGEVVSGMDVIDRIERGDTFTATATFVEPVR